MKVRIVRDVSAAPDGIKVRKFQRGESAEVPTKVGRQLVEMGAALALTGNGAVPEPDGPGGLAEGISPPAADGEVQELHEKGRELQKRLREAKTELRKASSRRNRLQDRQAEAEVADLLGEGAETPSEEEIREARQEVDRAQNRVRAVKEAQQKLGDRIEARLDELEEENRAAAEAAHADYLTHVLDVVSGAVEALEELQAFQRAHSPYLSVGRASVPQKGKTLLKKWLKRQRQEV